MANRIIQAVYDLKDNVTGKLRKISAALSTHRKQADKTADSVERDNRRVSDSYKKQAESVSSLRKVLGGLGIAYALNKLKEGILSVVQTGDKFELLQKKINAVFGGVEEGAKVFDGLKTLAKSTPQTLDQVTEAAIKLKAFGLDPLDGTLAKLIDDNARVGGSNERLQGTILQLGQAWTKQKLQGNDIRVLLEQGIPVYDLLAKATGRSAQEIVKMATAGELGRDAIKALINEMGKQSVGAAADQMRAVTGLVSNLKDRLDLFLNRVADSGALDFFKGKLTELGDKIAELDASGQLDQIAQRVSNAIVGIGKTIGSAVKFVTQFSGELLTLGKVMLALKLGKFAAGLGTVAAQFSANAKAALSSAAATETAAAANSRYSRITGKLSGLLKGGLGFAALGTAIGFTGAKLIEAANALSDYADQQAKLRQLNISVQVEQEALNDKIRDYKEAYAEFADVAIAGADELKQKTEQQTRSYEAQLDGARRYYSAIALEAKKAGDQAGFQAAQKHVQELLAALTDARGRVRDLGNEAKASEQKFSQFALDAAAQFDKLIDSGKSAKQAVSGLFDNIDLGNTAQLANVAEAVKLIGVRGTEAGDQIQRELRDRLAKMSDSDFERFKAAAEKAFAGGGDAAKLMADAIGNVNLARLGVDLDKIKGGFTEVGKAAVDAFKGAIVEIDKAGLTAEQRSAAIGQALDAALAKASTSAELNALGDALQAQFDKGDISADAFGKRIEEIKKRLADLKGSTYDVGRGVSYAQDQVAQSSREAADAVRKVGEALDNETHSAKGAVNALADALGDQRTEIAKISEAAAHVFDNLVAQTFKAGTALHQYFEGGDSGGGLLQGIAAISSAADEVKRRITAQQDEVARLTGYYQDLAQNGAGAFLTTRTSVASAQQDVQRLVQTIKNGTDSFTLLGDQDLAGLRQAADAAIQKMQQLKNEAKAADDQLSSIGQSLQDQIDQINGNQLDIEQRRYEEQLANIEELAKASGDANNANYREAKQRAEELHELQLKKIREEAQARKDSNTNTNADTRSSGGGGRSSGGGSGVGGRSTIDINLNGKNLQGIDLNDPAAVQQLAAAVIQQIKQYGNTSL